MIYDLIENIHIYSALTTDFKKAIEIIDNKAITEFSGNVSLDNIEDVGKIGVDYVSIGALTHSYKVLDLSIKNLKIIK